MRGPAGLDRLETPDAIRRPAGHPARRLRRAARIVPLGRARDLQLAEACCTRWARDPATAQRIAVHAEHEDGRRASHSFADIQAAANRLSRALRALGVRRGDRVAIILPQRIETVVAHMAVYQLAAIAMPLSMLFGPEAPAYRLEHGGARVAIADEGSLDNLLAARGECAALETVIGVGAPPGPTMAGGAAGRRAGRLHARAALTTARC